MNTVGFLLLAALAAFFVFAPRLGLGRTKSLDAQAAQKELLHERLGEIESDTSEEQAHLALEIASDLAQDRVAGDTTDRRVPGSVLVGLALLVPLLALGLFSALVDFERNALEGAEVVMTLDAEEDKEALAAWRVRLENYVANHPEDGQVQFLLGQTLLKEGQFEKAATAFARTHESSPGDLNVRIYWLQARFLAARGRLDDAGRKLAEDILAETPSLPVVLEILALDSVAQGDPAQAVSYLNRALSSAREGARVVSLVAAIGELRKQFELPGIDVHVKAEGEVPRSATVFVIARPVGGGMPFAVVRRPAALLPVKVRLDDLVSMSDARALTSAETFEVIVRLSLSGQAMAQAGDWQWTSSPQAITAQTQPLEVSLTQPDPE